MKHGTRNTPVCPRLADGQPALERGSPGATDRQYAVLLMAYGGPESLDDIEAYLLNLRGGRPAPPDLVAEIRQRYASIGGQSPLLEITRAQARALEERLNATTDGPCYRVYVGMRHWHPYIRQAVAKIVDDELRNVVALCMAPHYSRLSVGAYFEKLREAQDVLGMALNVAYVESYHDHPLFIQAIADKVQAALKRFPADARPRVKVIFTAHSLPTALMEEGDPYEVQVWETARLVAAWLGLRDENWQFCYQSAGARDVRWLGPQVENVVVALAEAGQEHILVAPIGFVADHLDILYNIDIEARHLAEQAGARLERTESLNTTPLFIEALADIVRRATDGSPEFLRVPVLSGTQGNLGKLF